MKPIFLDYPQNNYQAIGVIKGIYYPKNKQYNKGLIYIGNFRYSCRLLPRLAIFSKNNNLFYEEKENIFISWIRLGRKKQPLFILKHIILDKRNIVKFTPFINQFDIYGDIVKKGEDYFSLQIKRNILINPQNKDKVENQDFKLPIYLSSDISKRIKPLAYNSFCKTHCTLQFEHHPRLLAHHLFVKPNKKLLNSNEYT